MAPASRNLLAGAAGLGYVIAAGVENMELLGAPLLGSPAAEIRAARADRALAVVTASAGVVSLALYCVFVAALVPRLRVALAAGIAAALVALAGIGASAPLVLDGGRGLSDETVRTLFSLELSLRYATGPLIALFVLGVARVLPRRPAWMGRAIAVPLCLAPLAATGEHALQVAAMIAFGLNALWVWLASLWLTVGAGAPAAVAVRRAAFLMLVLAAGLVGIALLIVPGATGSFFAWGLAPQPLAAFAGGVYVGSAALYAAGLRAGWRAARALVAAAVVLSVSGLAISLIHLEVFDLDRLQAWAWLALFSGFAVTTVGLLAAGGSGEPAIASSPWTRVVLAAAAAMLAAAGIALWVDPAAGPLALPPLGGRFAGSWAVMLGVLAGWAAAAGGHDEARLAALGLVTLPAGALAAAARAPLDAGTATTVYIAALALLVTGGLGVLGATSPRLRCEFLQFWRGNFGTPSDAAAPPR
jgi:hypothetical protein